MDLKQRLTNSTSSSSGSLLSARSWLSGAGESDTSDDKIGPLGLNTLSIPSTGFANADLIFVHGLGGGSQKTWMKSGDQSLYWPKEWLPGEEAFKDVRIHSFGYDSNWGKKSILGIYDFANALLNCILDCPTIPQNTKAPIVLVGHSMGGLVIKRAYISAKKNTKYAALATRIQGALFLATPHRGSDLAQVFSKLLHLVGGNRPFVADLTRDSLALRSINDEFPDLCQDILLYSFYETVPTSFAIKKSLVVERDLAIMGYANERRDYLYADHRNVCKYDSRNDPNYLAVRNALVSTLAILRDRFNSSKKKVNNERRQLLDTLLGVSEGPEDEFMSADSHRMDGSVEWLIRKENFQEWIHYNNPPIYSITAKPATGKTVLSGKVITTLRTLGKRCSFHFFRHDTKEKSNIVSFLLSMAWQMAYSDEGIMNKCLEILEKDDHLKADYRALWRKLFLDGIFKVQCEQIHYWVIDALDECQNEADIILLLIRTAEVSSLHILTTSRNKFESRQKLGDSRVRVLSAGILQEDSKSDIMMYVEANVDNLPAVGEDGKQSIAYQIVEKSNGCFLWVSIVVQELRNVYTSTDQQKILDEIPTDMNELYARILNTMSKAPYGKELAKAIIIWTVCSIRPLKIPELHAALQLDLKTSIDSLEKSIRSYCGQLIYIDTNEQIQMTHLTARQFLLDINTKSEFAVNEKDGHRRLLLTILHFFNNDMVKSTRRRRSSVETGKALGTFLQDSTDQTLTNAKDIELLTCWGTDLVRLVMQFGKPLEAYPDSIFNLIPPFCPSETALRKQFGSSIRNINVRGLRAETWDDCLATVVDASEQYSSLACTNTQFAVGCFSGKISLFKQMTCQRITQLQHDEPVRLLIFGEAKNILVSAGSKRICVWDLKTKEQLSVFQTPQQCMAIALDDQDRYLLAALKNHRLLIWDLENEGPPEAIDWTQGLEAMTIRLYRRPTTAAFGIDSNLLAVIYKGQDILLWSLANDELVALYSRETGISAESLGKPYGSSGVRCLRDKKRIVAFAHILACSADGYMLATADPAGTIQLFNLETLQLIYRINSVEPGIQSLAFSRDNLRLLDTRGSRCRVWDLSDLVTEYPALRKENVSLAVDPEIPQSLNLEPFEKSVTVTSLACDNDGEAFFVGKEDGSVHVYSIESGQSTGELFTHARGVSIEVLYFEDQSFTLTSIDSSSRIMIHKLVREDRLILAGENILDYRADVAVSQLVCQPGLQHILICSTQLDMLWSISPGHNKCLTTNHYEHREPHRWSSHPHNPHQIILISSHTAHIHDWETLERLTDAGGIDLYDKLIPGMSIQSITPCFGGTALATTFIEPNQSNSKSKLVIWSTSDFTPKSKVAVPTPSYCVLSKNVEVLIGTTCVGTEQSERLVFLHGSQWVCATDMSSVKTNRFARHFFFPADWLDTTKDTSLTMKVTKKGDVLLVKEDEVAVVRRGLLTSELMPGGSNLLAPAVN
ncbi:hypothetical protein BPAE_0036g00370 [Botrytis paeoniae]|uniref:GPI inositol-deacylase n=1 Tax=Botrytis paeoniae TaxID=278948 RepID=A0A4Z1FSW7_9HELO|nr:hypothetical protein BPAE_0036g00370 [Botrytis paeoniae]